MSAIEKPVPADVEAAPEWAVKFVRELLAVLALPMGGKVEDQYLAIVTRHANAERERATREADRRWTEKAKDAFDGVRDWTPDSGFADPAEFVLHEVWKRHPKVEKAEAEARELRELTASLMAEKRRAVNERDAAQARVRELEHLAGIAWGVIANAGGGDWTKEPQVWQDAAASWRELHFESLRSEKLLTPPALPLITHEFVPCDSHAHCSRTLCHHTDAKGGYDCWINRAAHEPPAGGEEKR